MNLDFNYPGLEAQKNYMCPESEQESETWLGNVYVPTPCHVCGSVTACGYDSEGRPMIHTVEDTENESTK